MPENQQNPDQQQPQGQSHIKRDVAIAGGITAAILAGAGAYDAMNPSRPSQETPQPSGITEQANMPSTLGTSVETTAPSGEKVTVNFPGLSAEPSLSPSATEKPLVTPPPSPYETQLPKAEVTPTPTGEIGTAVSGTPAPTGEIGTAVTGTPEAVPTDKQILENLINGEHQQVSPEILLTDVQAVYENTEAEKIWPENYAIHDVTVTGENEQAALETLVDNLNKIYVKIQTPQSYQALKAAIDRAINVLGPSEKDRLTQLFQLTN